jgi:prepilin-type N-terminal cleavage/methylation domain-containing protein
MRQRGFSLVELLTVIAVIGILLSLSTIQFNSWMRKTRLEAQVQKVYADLNQVRTKAMFNRKGRSVTITSTQFAIFSSNVTTVTPVSSSTLLYPVTLNNGAKLDFDERGLLSNVTDASICVLPSDNGANIDSLVLSETRILMGKCNACNVLADCKSSNITAK